MGAEGDAGLETPAKGMGLKPGRRPPIGGRVGRGRFFGVCEALVVIAEAPNFFLQ